MVKWQKGLPANISLASYVQPSKCQWQHTGSKALLYRSCCKAQADVSPGGKCFKMLLKQTTPKMGSSEAAGFFFIQASDQLICY